MVFPTLSQTRTFGLKLNVLVQSDSYSAFLSHCFHVLENVPMWACVWMGIPVSPFVYLCVPVCTCVMCAGVFVFACILLCTCVYASAPCVHLCVLVCTCVYLGIPVA